MPWPRLSRTTSSPAESLFVVEFFTVPVSICADAATERRSIREERKILALPWTERVRVSARSFDARSVLVAFPAPRVAELFIGFMISVFLAVRRRNRAEQFRRERLRLHLAGSLLKTRNQSPGSCRLYIRN